MKTEDAQPDGAAADATVPDGLLPEEREIPEPARPNLFGLSNLLSCRRTL